MKKCFPLFVIGVLFGLIGCKTTCSEFDRKILNWIPYQENDVIELYSQLNHTTIIFPINSVYISHKTHYSSNTDCGGCDDNIFINNDNSDFHVMIDLYDNKMRGQNYKIIDTYFSTYSEEKKYIFENEEYELVRIFEADGSQGTFRTLIVADEIGVVGLIDIHGNIWTLKTNAKIKRLEKEYKNIVINNVSC